MGRRKGGGEGAVIFVTKCRYGVESTSGLPFAAIRGGNWNNGTEAGAFNLNLNNGPSNRNNNIGLRCCREKCQSFVPEPPSPRGRHRLGFRCI